MIIGDASQKKPHSFVQIVTHEDWKNKKCYVKYCLRTVHLKCEISQWVCVFLECVCVCACVRACVCVCVRVCSLCWQLLWDHIGLQELRNKRSDNFRIAQMDMMIARHSHHCVLRQREKWWWTFDFLILHYFVQLWLFQKKDLFSHAESSFLKTWMEVGSWPRILVLSDTGLSCFTPNEAWLN